MLVSNREYAERIVAQRLGDINAAMLEACGEAGSLPKKRYKPKHYWCPHLGYLRDTKKVLVLSMGY